MTDVSSNDRIWIFYDLPKHGCNRWQVFFFCNVRSTSEALWGWKCLKMLEKSLKSSGRARNSSHVCTISRCAVGLGLRLRPLPCIGRRWTHFEPHRRFECISRRLAAVLAEWNFYSTGSCTPKKAADNEVLYNLNALLLLAKTRF